ncbi:triose-phosphate isomerase [Patescibacteria group bacterium]|nr:triose-phosphate isomerase [Patescibacteria group bacterium]
MKKLIVANWKMNPINIQEAQDIFEGLRKRCDLALRSNPEIVICPPFIYLSQLSGITLGAQNCYWEEKGAYTGEVSVAMLKELGCQYVIVGHSERRKYFMETDEMVNKKTKAVLEAGLTPIVCIGETQEEREGDKTEAILEEEITKGLEGIDLSKIVIAYEPIWAIGTGNACDVDEAQRMKEVILKMTSKDVKIIYGGSANASNAEGYLKQANFDGLLVGGASLNPQEFTQIISLAK